MCLPAAAIPLVISAVSAAASIATGVISMNQQNKTASAMAASANQAAAVDYSILDRRQTEVDAKSALEMTERQRQGLKERAKLMVAIGESGVGGNSPLREIENSMMGTNYDLGIMGANRASESSQIQDEKRGVYSTTTGRVNQAKSQYVNPMVGMLKIGTDAIGSGLVGYGMGSQLFPSSGGASSSKNAIRDINRGGGP